MTSQTTRFCRTCSGSESSVGLTPIRSDIASLLADARDLAALPEALYRHCLTLPSTKQTMSSTASSSLSPCCRTSDRHVSNEMAWPTAAMTSGEGSGDQLD